MAENQTLAVLQEILLKSRIKFVTGTEAEWTAANPVLLDGEYGLIRGCSPLKYKVGDGTKTWSALGWGNVTSLAQLTADATHRLVTDSEKKTWGDKAAKDLSNVTLTKALSSNGYYKAPDGLMFQWGISPGGAYQYYFSPAFIAKPFGCFLTAYYGNGNVITAASYVELTAQYLRYQSRWANLTDKNGGLASTTETVHWLVIGRWK